MNAIPKQYNFLTKVGTLPKLLEVGLNYLGIAEYPGTNSNNPVIMDMARQLGISHIYKNDETAWCALFMCHLCVLANKPMPYKEYEILRAASFRGGGATTPPAWGQKVKKGDERLGDILVFDRPNGDHVGIYTAETPTHFVVFGGNQSNCVSFMEIAKSRLTEARRYYKVGMPASAQKYIVKSTGVVSVNEA